MHVQWGKVETLRAGRGFHRYLGPDVLARMAQDARPRNRPAADHPSDGLNLLPLLTREATPVPRRLFWRFKGNAQEAVRDGDLKFLKINENAFLFDLAADPMERANLKDRRPEEFQRLAAAWSDWQATMLPPSDTSFTRPITAADQADHIGAK